MVDLDGRFTRVGGEDRSQTVGLLNKGPRIQRDRRQAMITDAGEHVDLPRGQAGSNVGAERVRVDRQLGKRDPVGRDRTRPLRSRDMQNWRRGPNSVRSADL